MSVKTESNGHLDRIEKSSPILNLAIRLPDPDSSGRGGGLRTQKVFIQLSNARTSTQHDISSGVHTSARLPQLQPGCAELVPLPVQTYLFSAGNTADLYPLLSSRERLPPGLLYLKMLCSNRMRSLPLFLPVTNVLSMPKFSSPATTAEKLMYIIGKVDWVTRMNVILVNSSHALQT
jgi:hypothetical protein